MTNISTDIPAAKRSFDFKRTDHYLCDPIADLCIFGGRTHLTGEQAGDLDTVDDSTHALHDPRIMIPLDEPFVRNVDAKGVEAPVIIVKMDDLAMVIDGRQRVRAARVVNRRRAAQGLPLIKVPSIIKRVKDKAALLMSMVGLNENRFDDDFPSKMTKLRRLMDAGITDPEELGPVFRVSAAVIESWLRFDDMAVDSVKAAVDAGRLALSAGVEIARLREPAKQEQALASLANASQKSISTRKAREAAKLVERPDAHMGVTDKRTQTKLLKLVESKDHKGASKDALSWWAGVEAALTLIVGGDEKPDERLLALLGEARIASDTPAAPVTKKGAKS